MSQLYEMSNGFDKQFYHYLDNIEKYNLHKQKIDCYEKLPSEFSELPHILCYGPCGVGKYSQALKIIEKYLNQINFLEKLLSNITFVQLEKRNL